MSIKDILAAVERQYEVRERLVPGLYKPGEYAGSHSSGLMELVALVEEYFAAQEARQDVCTYPESGQQAAKERAAATARFYKAEDALRAVIA